MRLPKTITPVPTTAPGKNTDTFIDLTYASKNDLDVFDIKDTTNSSLCEYYNGYYKKMPWSIREVRCLCGKSSIFYGSQNKPARCRFEDKGRLYGELLDQSFTIICSIL